MTIFPRIGAYGQLLTDEQLEKLELMQMVDDGADQTVVLWSCVLAIEGAMRDCSDESTKQRVRAAIEDTSSQVEAIKKRAKQRRHARKLIGP